MNIKLLVIGYQF